MPSYFIKGISTMGTLLQDVKFGFRLFLPGRYYDAISVSLSLGHRSKQCHLSQPYQCGAIQTTECWRFIPLVSLYTSDFSGPQYGASSYADFVDLRDKATSLRVSWLSLRVDESEIWESVGRAFGLLVSGNYFDLLRCQSRAWAHLPAPQRLGHLARLLCHPLVTTCGRWRFGGMLRSWEKRCF